MKAIVYRRYGAPDVLRYEDVDQPVPDDDQVLLEVRAASVNPYDWHFMRGTPYVVRLLAGLSKPKVARLGVDVAGVVEAVGRNVTRFGPGDAVFGMGRGAFAERACAAEAHLARKPDGVTFEQAACAPVAGLTALQGLRDAGGLQSGQKVLINGAAGGVGTWAVQIAKSFGARVTGVCSTRNLDMVRSIGADAVIDYTRDDPTQGERRYDLIFDCVGNHSFSARRRILEPKGICVSVGAPDMGRWIGPFVEPLVNLVRLRFVSQRFVLLLARRNKDDLASLGGLLRSGQVTPVIDRRYRLSAVPEALRYLEEGHARGKVVITPEGDDTTPRSAAT